MKRGDGERLRLVAGRKHACPSGLHQQGNPARALGHCWVTALPGSLGPTCGPGLRLRLCTAVPVGSSARRKGMRAGASLGLGPGHGVSGLHQAGRELAPVGAAVSSCLIVPYLAYTHFYFY